jgi:hypothetical protein
VNTTVSVAPLERALIAAPGSDMTTRPDEVFAVFWIVVSEVFCVWQKLLVLTSYATQYWVVASLSGLTSPLIVAVVAPTRSAEVVSTHLPHPFCVSPLPAQPQPGVRQLAEPPKQLERAVL